MRNRCNPRCWRSWQKVPRFKFGYLSSHVLLLLCLGLKLRHEALYFELVLAAFVFDIGDALSVLGNLRGIRGFLKPPSQLLDLMSSLVHMLVELQPFRLVLVKESCMLRLHLHNLFPRSHELAIIHWTLRAGHLRPFVVSSLQVMVLVLQSHIVLLQLLASLLPLVALHRQILHLLHPIRRNIRLG